MLKWRRMKYQICESCLHVATTTLVQLDYKNERAVPVDLTFGGDAKAIMFRAPAENRDATHLLVRLDFTTTTAVLPAHNIAGRHS